MGFPSSDSTCVANRNLNLHVYENSRVGSYILLRLCLVTIARSITIAL